MLKNIIFTFLIEFVITIHAQHRSRRPPSLYQNKPLGLQLPDNSTSIRENIVDKFSCNNRIYGYYADIDNECQIFHICVPQARYTKRYSFICSAETVFDQVTFVCNRIENSIPCEESEKYYYLNEQFGKTDQHTNETNPTRPPYPGNFTQRTMRPTPPTTPGYWTTQTSPHGSTQNPTRPTYLTTTTDNWNSQRPTRPPSQHTSTSNYPTTQYPQRPTKPPTFPITSRTADWLTTQYPSRPTRPPTYPPSSSSSTTDFGTSQRPQRPTRPPNRPTTTSQSWTTQFTQRPPRPMTSITPSWQYLDDDYANY